MQQPLLPSLLVEWGRPILATSSSFCSSKSSSSIVLHCALCWCFFLQEGIDRKHQGSVWIVAWRLCPHAVDYSMQCRYTPTFLLSVDQFNFLHVFLFSSFFLLILFMFSFVRYVYRQIVSILVSGIVCQRLGST